MIVAGTGQAPARRWTPSGVTQRVDGAGGMGYDRGMAGTWTGQTGARLASARMSAETGSVGWDGDGAWDGGVVRMPLGTGHPPVEPRRVGRPSCRRRSRQGLPRVTGADSTPSTLRSSRPS